MLGRCIDRRKWIWTNLRYAPLTTMTGLVVIDLHRDGARLDFKMGENMRLALKVRLPFRQSISYGCLV